MKNYIFVDANDASFFEGLELPLPVAFIQSHEGSLQAFHDGLPLPDHHLYPNFILGIALSKGGQESLKAFAQLIAGRFDCAAPSVVDFSRTARGNISSEVYLEIANTLAEEVQSQATRSVALTKSLVSLRKEHERTQMAFSLLEMFVQTNNLNQRTESFTLSPADQCGSISLSDDVGMEQRLAISSSGISDIGLFVSEVGGFDGGGGALVITLSTLEDGAEHATWNIPGDALRDGFVRCCLPVALGPEKLTPLLSLNWFGGGSVRLPAALYHPDTRFQAQVAGKPDERVLACRVWTYIPSNDAKIPVEGFLPNSSGEGLARERTLDWGSLSRAINLNTKNTNFRKLENIHALQVHVRENSVSAAVVPAVVPARTMMVRARILTRSEHAADIDYAMGIAPKSVRARPDEPLPDFPDGQVTPWVRLVAQEPGELHLPLAEPLEEAHDLYLMTRLSDGSSSANYGWSTFDKIALNLG